MSTANLVDEVAKEFGFTLKEKQKEVISAFISGNDVFCCLPTGYGKSLCYSILPKVYDRIRNVKGLSIVLCVSPLVALMMDQKKKCIEIGISAEFISETHCDIERVRGIKEGTSQLIFMSPESLLNNRRWRDVLLSRVFTDNLVCIAIDEAHCVPKW